MQDPNIISTIIAYNFYEGEGLRILKGLNKYLFTNHKKYSRYFKQFNKLKLFGINKAGQTNSPPVPQEDNIISMHLNEDNTIYLTSNGNILGNGMFMKYKLQDFEQFQSSAIDIACNDYYALVVTDRYEIYGVGEWYKYYKARLRYQGRVKGVRCGYEHYFLILLDNSLVGYGYNTHGQLTIPCQVKNNFKDLKCGTGHNLFLTRDNCLYATGDNDDGQCDVPDEVQGDVVSIVAGNRWSGCLTRMNTVRVWGYGGNFRTESIDGKWNVSEFMGSHNDYVIIYRDGIVESSQTTLESEMSDKRIKQAVFGMYHYGFLYTV